MMPPPVPIDATLPSTPDVQEAIRLIRHYHERTKHYPGRYAKGPEGLDWDDQPAAFRDYGEVPCLPLPLPKRASAPTFAEVADGRIHTATAMNRDSIGQLFGLSLAISAWKRYGNARWALRCNPSSGNLHPTEAYLLSGGSGEIPAGLYLYSAEAHSLALRCRYSPDFTAQLAPHLPEDGVLVGLSSIAWREAWKYGERAWRYCQLDLGHALACLRYATASLGWHAEPLQHWKGSELAALTGLDRLSEFPADEPERPELLLAVGPIIGNPKKPPGAHLLSQLSEQEWQGEARRLSPRHDHDWAIIDQVAAATATSVVSTDRPCDSYPPPLHHADSANAFDLIRSRRSAQYMDGVTGMSKPEFFRLIDHLLPRPGLPPWGRNPALPQVHLIFFLHRVAGLEDGIYVLYRHADAAESLKAAMLQQFEWRPVQDCPSHINLRLLYPRNAQHLAASLACRQSIAGDGAFCVAMLGEFDAALKNGASAYSRLMQEAGTVGQALYLEAEAAGLQGTGIGCFFDDALHDLLGIHDDSFQVLYQFTVGKALVDIRIANEPAYLESDST